MTYLISTPDRGTLPVVTVRKQGKRWAVHLDGELFEGGFFSREAAHVAASNLHVEMDKAARRAVQS